MSKLKQIIENKLLFTDYKTLEIVNESELHRGHMGYGDGETHFKILIISNYFKDISKINRHKIIYKALDNEMKTKIHALSITALIEEEYLL